MFEIFIVSVLVLIFQYKYIITMQIAITIYLTNKNNNSIDKTFNVDITWQINSIDLFEYSNYSVLGYSKV